MGVTTPRDSTLPIYRPGPGRVAPDASQGAAFASGAAWERSRGGLAPLSNRALGPPQVSRVSTVPYILVDELQLGAILVAPVGDDFQVLVRWTKRADGITKERLGGVRFVPMVPAKGD